MHIVERVLKIIVAFAVFIVAQGLLAGSINTIFDLIPLRLERLFPRADGLSTSACKCTQQQQQQQQQNATSTRSAVLPAAVGSATAAADVVGLAL